MSVRARGIAGLAVLLAAHTVHAGSQITARHAALSTASPYATQIGLSVLKNGGNAIDAAVAISFALAVAQPQAGNLGGGGFLVYYDAKSKAVWTLDYREVAPLAATRNMFAKDANAAQVGALAAGAPGALAGLGEMHRKFGSRPWSELVAPAARLAREGVRVDGDLAAALLAARSGRNIDRFASTAAIFYPDGKPLAAGATLLQADLAATLTRLALKGARDFYDGDSGNRFVDAVKAAGGIVSYRDLREYKAVWRAPIRVAFRNYQLYTMAPPSAGGLVIGEALNILDGFDLEKGGFQSPKSLHLIAEAERRAFIDRTHYLGDPATVRIPYRELLSDERAKQWRASIKVDRATPTTTLAEPGTTIPESNHTTHFSVVDASGNIAAVTTSLGDDFGSGVLLPGVGFFLNAAMADFSTAAGSANLIEPQKRPATSMAPAIVFHDEKPLFAFGTPGGATIPTTLLGVFLNVAVWHKSLYDAIAAPRFHQQDAPDDLAYEQGTPQPLIDALSAMGHGVAARPPMGDVHAVLIEGGKLTAIADARHGGAAGGY